MEVIMDRVLETIKTRRSIRAYKPDMVEKELIDKVIEAGTYAATGRGNQSPIIIAVTNREVRDKLSKMNGKIMGTDTDPFYGAPVVLIVLADKTKNTYLYDGVTKEMNGLRTCVQEHEVSVLFQIFVKMHDDCTSGIYFDEKFLLYVNTLQAEVELILE